MIEIALGAAGVAVGTPLYMVHKVFGVRMDIPRSKMADGIQINERATRIGSNKMGKKIAYDLVYGNPPHGKLIIFMHGNGGSASMMRRYFSAVGEDCSMMAIDALSHGRSDKRRALKLPTFIDELNAGIDEAINQGWKTENIILCGYSLGGSAAIACASMHNVKGVIAIAPFVDAASAYMNLFKKMRMPVFLRKVLIKYINWNVGNNISQLSPVATMHGVECPVHIIAGEKDDITGIEEVAMLEQSHENVHLEKVKRGHMDIFLSPKTKSTLGRFLRECLV